jgi:peptidoglycan hydrolase-like protein with peptidoglycan-binding domain
MRINLQKATHLASSLLLAAGLGVFSDSVQARPAGRKAGGSTAHGSSHKRPSSRSKRRERGQQAPTPERITEIQQALAKGGSYTGKPTGKWDDSTAEAMRKFQESHSLSPTGKLDARSLQLLGLGSPIAGVAAPPHSTTTSRLTAPATQSAQPHH